MQWDRAKPDGMPRKLMDSSRIAALGWKPATSLADGLRRTYSWYRQQLGESRSGVS
jgi:GDP-L-fucose synthase